MKKLLTFVMLLFAVLTATAAEPTVVGEDNYQPAGASFAWDFDIDFQTQKFAATVDLSTCTGTNENVASFGTDISNYFGAVYPGGNIHFYYTAETKTLTCTYVSVVNETFGVYRFNRSYENVEGELQFDLSYQYGLRMNGKQVFASEAINNIVTQTKLQFGSKEGNNRSNAVYKQARVEDAPFEATEAVSYTTYSRTALGDAVSHSLNTTVSLQQTGLDAFKVVLKDVTVGGKLLGDVSIDNVTREAHEGSGNDANSYYYTKLENGTAVLSNAGALATELGLADGAELTVTKVNGFVWGGELTGSYNLTVGDKELTVSVGYDGFSQKTFSKPLTTTFSDGTQTYEDKPLVFSDFGDGFAQLAFNNLQFASTADADMGNLVLTEVPYTKENGEYVFSLADREETLQNTPTEALKTWTNLSVEGKVSGDAAYFEVNASVKNFNMNVALVYGTPIAEAKVYTDKMTIDNNGETEEREDATMSIRDDGDGNYYITFFNVGGEEAISFKATGTTDPATGRTTYEADQAEWPMTQSGWEGYSIYVSIAEAYSEGDKLYADMYVDLGGYGAYYPAYAYYVIFGNKNLTAVNSVETTENSKAVEFYNVNGMRLSAPMKGVNIVRTADGKTYKQLVK